MKITTRLKAAAATMSVALTVVACGNETGSAGDGDAGKITFVAAEYSTNTKPYWENLIKEFEAANDGIEVDLQVINWDDIDAHVTTLVQNNKQPDILNLNKFADFAADDLLQPAADVVSPEVLEDFIPSFAENSKLDGTQYGLPFIASARLLFYNTELFEQAKVEPPKTWDDLKAAAAKIDALGDDIYGYGLPLGPEEAQAEFQLWANGNGGHWVDDAGNWTIASDENVETLEFLTGLVDDGLTQPNPAKTDRADVFNAFSQGKIGMLRGHPQLQTIIADQGGKIEYAIAPNPANGDNPSTTLGVQDYLMAFDNEGNTEAVKKFLDFFYQEGNYAELLTTEGFLPVTESAGAKLAGDEKLKPFIDALPSAKFYPVTDPAWTKVDGEVKKIIGTAVQGGDPRQVLEQIQKRAEG